MQSNNIIFEGKTQIQENITSHLIIFYEHFIKYITLINNQSASWINSMIEHRSKLKDIKKNSPAAYKDYSIFDNINYIRSKYIKRIMKDNPTKNINDFNQKDALAIFNTLDKITDDAYFINALKRYAHTKGIEEYIRAE